MHYFTLSNPRLKVQVSKFRILMCGLIFRPSHQPCVVQRVCVEACRVAERRRIFIAPRRVARLRSARPGIVSMPMRAVLLPSALTFFVVLNSIGSVDYAELLAGLAIFARAAPGDKLKCNDSYFWDCCFMHSDLFVKKLCLS